MQIGKYRSYTKDDRCEARFKVGRRGAIFHARAMQQMLHETTFNVATLFMQQFCAT